ncbi:methyltransferase domain-containing protein [Bdellovibrio sp. HCB288]|uniref:methyltransferase domain-containing protein n=1 Tax=Bdellovibrio sp. HCB288 TaxID=3394355 RepID=UPI0039B4E932
MSGTWNPNQYEKFKNERSQPFFDLLDFIKPDTFKEAIDLGCGTGELTRIMHDRFKPQQTTGMDSSGEMLAKTKSFSSADLNFLQGDIDVWEKPDAYDLIVSNAALQWSPGHRDLFQRLHRSLRPGGQLAVQMPMNHDYPTHVLSQAMSHEEHWKKALGGHTYDKPKTMLTVEEYANLIYKLGFQEQRVELKVYGHILPTREGVIEWVRGSMLTYFEKHMSKTDYADFLQEYQSRLFQILPDDKPFFYPFKRVFIWARKAT